MKREDQAPCPAAIGSTAAPHAQLLSRSPYSASDPVHTHALGIALERQRGVHAIGTDHRKDFDTWPGTLAYTLPGVDVFSESETGGEYLVVRWEGDSMELSNFPGREERVQWTARGGQWLAARHLRGLLLAPAPDALAIEQATWTFLGLMELQRGPTRHGTRAQAPLRAVYGRVLDRIASDFAQPLTIAQLAAAEGRQPLQFLREFTQLVGLTPHAFIVETRVQAARAMLRAGNESLAAVALDCGFSHQSHMGAAFRKLLSQTPRRYASNAGLKPR